MIDIHTGRFDDPDALVPQARIQTADAPRWMRGIADLPGFERYPELEQYVAWRSFRGASPVPAG